MRSIDGVGTALPVRIGSPRCVAAFSLSPVMSKPRRRASLRRWLRRTSASIRSRRSSGIWKRSSGKSATPEKPHELMRASNASPRKRCRCSSPRRSATCSSPSSSPSRCSCFSGAKRFSRATSPTCGRCSNGCRCCCVFLCSALTMRMWSEERRSGTLEFVSTVPVTTWSFVLGKFFACWLLLAIALLLTLPLPLTVAYLGNLDWGPVLAGYVAALLLGGAYIAIGLTISARSDNQIVSLILSTLACGALYLVGSPLLTDHAGNDVGVWLRGIGTGSRFESITRGVLDFRDLYYYVSLILTFLALNVFALERQRWAKDGDHHRHSAWQLGIGLVVANLLVANLWLASLTSRARRRDEGRSVFDFAGDDELHRSAARAVADPRLFLVENASAAGAAGAADERPAAGIRSGRPRQGARRNRRPREESGSRRRSEQQIRHSSESVPGRRSLSVEPRELLFRRARAIRRPVRSARLPRSDRSQGGR